MTYPYGEDPLDGLDATPAERLEYLRALDEVEAAEAGVPYEAPEPGGWDGFNAAAAQMDAAHALDAQLDAQRLAEDVADQIPGRRPPTDEVKLQRAMDRIESGTYTPPAPAQPARDAYGQFTSACGQVDPEFGRCAERFHDPSCSAVIAGAAATGSETEAQAWRDTLAAHPPDPGTLGYAAELAEPADPADTWADLLQAPGSADPRTVHARVLSEMGEAETPPAEPREQYPPVGDLRSALGL